MKTFTVLVTFLFLLITTHSFPQLEQAPLREDTAYSFDNVPIVYQKTGNGKEVLVFIHCWSCDKSYWANQLEYFANNYTVIAIDLAGHGESGFDRTGWTIENYGKDVKAVVEKEKLNNVILIGHSMGGAVVLSAAQQSRNSGIKALIGIDTFQDIEYMFTKEQYAGFVKPFEEDFRTATKEFIKQMFPENADSNLVEMISSDMSSAPKDVALASFNDLFSFNEAENFDKINIPVRFLNADHYPTNVESAKRHIKDFGVKIMKGAGHFLMLENPVEFNKLLEETITGLSINK